MLKVQCWDGENKLMFIACSVVWRIAFESSRWISTEKNCETLFHILGILLPSGVETLTEAWRQAAPGRFCKGKAR